MRTLIIDVVNEKALNLLKELEVLKLIHLRNEKPETNSKTKWLKYKGSMTKQPLKSIERQLNQLRNEWE